QEAVERAHAHYYVDFAEAAEQRFAASDQTHWFALMEAEHTNLLDALRWSVEQRAVELGLRLVLAVHRYWVVRGALSPLQECLTQLLAAMEQTEQQLTPPEQSRLHVLQARALNVAGQLVSPRGDWAQAEALYAKSLSLWRRLGEPKGIAISL